MQINQALLAMLPTLASQQSLPTPKIGVRIDTETGEVTVNLYAPPAKALILSHIQPYNAPLKAGATAVATGGVNVCVIALEEEGRGAVSAEQNAILNANNCAIFSNSSSTAGVLANGRAKVSASQICSAGGYSGGVANFDPLPISDCPTIVDPLIDRLPPAVGACESDKRDLVLGDSSARAAATAIAQEIDNSDSATANRISFTLQPGVYCGGLDVGSNADVTLAPGDYIIKDGSLTIGLGASFKGKDVSFYLTGDGAVLDFQPSSKIELEARRSGPMAGILFFEERSAPAGRRHRILSADARVLLGTFYLPRGELFVASLRPVADQSAYTAVVANRLSATGSPTLVLNSNYAATNVPTPEGVGHVGGSVMLRE